MATYKCPNCSFIFGNRLQSGKHVKSVDGYKTCPNCHKDFIVGNKQTSYRLVDWVTKGLDEWSKETGLTKSQIVNIALTGLLKEWDRKRKRNLEEDPTGRDQSEAGRQKRLKGIPLSSSGVGGLTIVEKK